MREQVAGSYRHQTIEPLVEDIVTLKADVERLKTRVLALEKFQTVQQRVNESKLSALEEIAGVVDNQRYTLGAIIGGCDSLERRLIDLERRR